MNEEERSFDEYDLTPWLPAWVRDALGQKRVGADAAMAARVNRSVTVSVPASCEMCGNSPDDPALNSRGERCPCRCHRVTGHKENKK